MATRVQWEDRFLIQQCVNYLYENPRFDKDANIGITGDASADSGKFMMPLTNHPHLPSPTTINNLELATGRSDAYTVEHVATAAEAPTFTLDMPANAHNLSLFLWSIFQTGASESEASGTITMTCVPYTSPVPEMWLSVVRIMESINNLITKDASSHMVYGCICRSLTLSAEEGGLLNLSAEIAVGGHRIMNQLTTSATNHPRINYYPVLNASDTVFYNGTEFATLTAKNSTFTAPTTLTTTTVEVCTSVAFTDGRTDESIKIGDFNFPSAKIGDTITINAVNSAVGVAESWSTHDAMDTTAFLKWQDANIFLGSDTTVGNLNPVNLPGFSITITNNAQPHFYNSPIPYKYTLGKLEVTGSFFLPWGTTTEGGNKVLTDYKAGTDTAMRIYWESPLTAADTLSPLAFAIDVNMIKDDVSIEGDIELGSQTNFKLVSDGTYGLAIRTAYHNDTLDRGL